MLKVYTRQFHHVIYLKGTWELRTPLNIELSLLEHESDWLQVAVPFASIISVSLQDHMVKKQLF